MSTKSASFPYSFLIGAIRSIQKIFKGRLSPEHSLICPRECDYTMRNALVHMESVTEVEVLIYINILHHFNYSHIQEKAAFIKKLIPFYL